RLTGAQHQFAECIADVHHIEERKPGVHTGRRQNLKERAMRSVFRIPVARSVIVSSAYPRFDFVENRRLPAGFERIRLGTLCEDAPRTALESTPQHHV